MQKPMSVELVSEGLSFKAETGNSTLLWPDIHSWREDGQYILLYIAPKIYHVLPVRIADSGFPIGELKERLITEVGAAT